MGWWLVVASGALGTSARLDDRDLQRGLAASGTQHLNLALFYVDRLTTVAVCLKEW